MMRGKYIIPTLCVFGTMSLHAEDKGLGNILQQAGQKKVLEKPESNKKQSKKQSRFVFKDVYDSNGIGSKDKNDHKNSSETYNYDDKSRFKFKFNDGYDQSNFVGGSVNGGMGGSGGVGPGSGGGGGRR
ncbi:MAG TPA: hypothetical protein VLL31_05555 [Sulfurovum sp.]|nr:hypothetical protein [Sulfurovum sp.]